MCSCIKINPCFFFFHFFLYLSTFSPLSDPSVAHMLRVREMLMDYTMARALCTLGIKVAPHKLPDIIEPVPASASTGTASLAIAAAGVSNGLAGMGVGIEEVMSRQLERRGSIDGTFHI
jgi:hypothetical protein